MAYEKKYRPGDRITSLTKVIKALEKDNFIYVRNKIYHSGWILSQQIKYLNDTIKGGHVKEAVNIKKADVRYMCEHSEACDSNICQHKTPHKKQNDCNSFCYHYKNKCKCKPIIEE